MINNNKLAECELGIEKLANGLGIPENEIVNILREGIESRSPIGQINEINKYFIDEMTATFDAY